MTLDVNSNQFANSLSLPNVIGSSTQGLHSSKPYWITQKNLAKKLCMSVDALRKLFKADADAPQKIKLGEARQAPVYYMIVDVEVWVMSKKAAFSNQNIVATVARSN